MELSKWFNLSYAGFLVLPRVTMEDMSQEWRDKMAELLEEHDKMFPGMSDLPFTFKVSAIDVNGRFVKLPHQMCNYRHPDDKYLFKLKQGV